jgi:hypothetical protein
MPESIVYLPDLKDQKNNSFVFLQKNSISFISIKKPPSISYKDGGLFTFLNYFTSQYFQFMLQ